MGGSRVTFGQTDVWSQIAQLAHLDSVNGKPIVGNVIGRYWKPVYCYLRRSGCSDVAAKDLSQGFFCDVVLGRKLLRKADPTKGSFRAFLKSALRNYVKDRWRRENIKRRIPSDRMVSLEGVGGTLPDVTPAATPDEAFNLAWAGEVIREAVDETKKACLSLGHEAHWKVFWHRDLGPKLEGCPPIPLAELCRQLNLPSNKHASNLAQTARRRFEASLRARVRETVASGRYVDAELADLMKDLVDGAQQSPETRVSVSGKGARRGQAARVRPRGQKEV